MAQGMSVADAAYHVVHDYPGGAAALQVRMGKTNLSAEVNPNVPGAKLGLEDSVTAQLMARDFRILYAMAMELGHYPPPLMPEGAAGDGEVCLQALSETAKEFSDLVAAVVAAAADGHISDNEMSLINKERDQLIVKVQALMQRLASLHLQLKARVA